MKYLSADSNIQIPVDIKVGGEFTVPSSDIDVRVNVGGVTTDTVIPMTETSVVDIPLIVPPLALGTVGYITITVGCSTPLGFFRVIKRFPVFNYDDLYGNGDGVRELLGVKEFEYADDYFDLEGVYLKLYRIFQPTFHAARLADPYLNKLFGDLINITAALNVAPSLLIRLADKEETENGKFDRWGDPKYLNQLIDSLKTKYYDTLKDLGDFVIPTTITPLIAPALVPMLHHATGDTN